MLRLAHGLLAASLSLSLGATAFAQEPKSAPLARQLAAALDSAKLDSIAAADPSKPGTFVAALYFANTQLLVVSAKYTAPQLLTDRLGKKEYRDVYIDLNSASVPESKVFVEDLFADGLKAKRDEDRPYDTYELAGKRTAFDGKWKDQKLSEQDYMKAWTAADEAYADMLTALLAQVKKPTS
jgi:hypothetical protein